MKYVVCNYKAIDNEDVVKASINDFWFCRLLKGNAKVEFDLSRHTVRAGTLFVVPEGVQFRVVASTHNMAMEVLVFDESLMNVVYALLGAEVDVGTLPSSFWTDRGFEDTFARLLALDYEALKIAIEHPSLVACHKAVAASLVHLLVTIYNAVGPSAEGTQKQGGDGSRVLINRFYEMVGRLVPSGERSIGRYAERLCISERYLYTVCKKEAGQSPKEIVDDFLIAAIKNALLTTDLNLQQIADKYCFPDQTAFGQYFKRKEGLSPSEFRRRYR